jgi:hypothetical protein
MIGFYTEPQFGEKFGETQTQEKIMAIMRSKPRIGAKALAEKIGNIFGNTSALLWSWVGSFAP